MTHGPPQFPIGSPNLQQFHLLCQQCSYQLIGMPRDGQCPECHHPISISRKAWIAEEAVAGIATQSLIGVCFLIFARNLCILALFFIRSGALPTVILFCAFAFEALASLSLRGVLPIAQTP